MLKSIFLILISNYVIAATAGNSLNSQANQGDWKNFLPQNFGLISEMGERAFQGSSDASSEVVDDRFLLSRDPFMVFKPNSRVETARKTKSGVNIYDTVYTFDAYSRRLTTTDYDQKRQNIILLGCSYTLGTGVGDSETFASYLASLRKNFNVYNMGIYSAGTNDVLDDLRAYKRFSDISKSGGVMVYTGIPDHFERTLCTLNCYRSPYRDSVLKKSNYFFDEKNWVLINKGSFNSTRPLQGPLFSLIGRISLFDKFNFPSALTDQQIDLFMKFLVEMKEIARNKFNSDFYFTFYPDQYENWPRIKSALQYYKISYLDFSEINLKAETGNRSVILLDGHPTKLAHYLFANLLHQSLPNKF